MLGYFDDSGTHAGSQVTVLAGYLGVADEWATLEREWNAVLDREHLKFYHTVDCNQGQEQFDGWTTTRRNVLHREFVEIITRRRLTAIGMAVNVRTLPAEASACTTELLSSFARVLTAIGQFVSQTARNEKIALVVESKRKADARLTERYHDLMDGRLRKYAPYFAGPPAFRPKEGYPQLQAADVLAWEMYAGAGRHFFPSVLDPARKSWQALTTHCDVNGGLQLYALEEMLEE